MAFKAQYMVNKRNLDKMIVNYQLSTNEIITKLNLHLLFLRNLIVLSFLNNLAGKFMIIGF